MISTGLVTIIQNHYSIIDSIPTLHPVTYSAYNWKYVSLNYLHLFCLTSKTPLL